MSLRLIKKKFRQEVLVDSKGELNRTPVVVYRFVVLCARASAGLFLSIFLGPFSLVRPIEIWLMKLGPDKASHFINGIELHLRRNQIKKNNKVIAVVVWPQRFPNEALAMLYRQIVYIVGPKQKFFAKVLPFIFWKVTVYGHGVNSAEPRLLELLDNGTPSINFDRAQIKAGEKLEKTLFGESGRDFIVLSYTSKEYRAIVDAEFHSKDNLNEAIPRAEKFVSVVSQLNQKDIKVVRQGLYLSECPTLTGAGLIVPNCHELKAGFSDVWLTSRCKFLLVANTGAYWFAEALNKPYVMTDVITVQNHNASSRGTFIFSLCWNEEKQEFASFQWMKDNPRWCYDSARVGKSWKIVHNTPEQIVDVVTEKLARINGEWVDSVDDEELQKRFQRFVFGEVKDFSFLPRVGAKFLKEYQHLLPN